MDQIETSTLKDYISHEYSKSVVLDILLAAANEETVRDMSRRLCDFEYKFTNFLVRKGDILNLSKLPDITSDLINSAKNQEMVDYLLSERVDLNEVETIDESVSSLILQFILTKILKVKINPNRLLKNTYGTPFWRAMRPPNFPPELFSEQVAKNNFTEAININVKNGRGETVMHVNPNLQQFFKYKPDPYIKSNAGLAPREYRQRNGLSIDVLDEYIKTFERGIAGERIKELENLVHEYETQIAEYEAKQEQLRALIM